MILKICAMYDSATQMFGRPFFVVATGQAVRSFKDEVNRKEAGNELANHPDDFTLYGMGEFDDNTGQWNITAPEQLIRGKDLKTE